MRLKDQLRRHRKDHRIILGGLALLLVLLASVYYLLLRSRDLPSYLVNNKLLFFVLFYINVVLILTILFIFARNLFKLLLERRSRILGSRFRVKLVATYVGLSLIPVSLLFLYASELLQRSVDRWFNVPAAEVLQHGAEVAQAMNRTLERITLRDAYRVSRELGPLEIDRPEQRARLASRLRQSLSELELDFLAAYRDAIFVHGVVNPQAGLSDLPEPRRSFLVQAALDGEASQWQVPSTGGGRLVFAAVAVGPVDPHRPVLVAGRLLDPATATTSEKLIRAYQNYRQSEVQRAEIKASQLLFFLMITLLILLASSWVGLFLARRVTVPIQALAEGTRRISDGDLTHRVEVDADDELGILVDSFNAMTDELHRNRELLEASNRELLTANRRLAEERALMVAVLESVAAGVIALDRDDRVFLCNGAALRMLKQREEEVLGKPIQEAWDHPWHRRLLKPLEERPSSGTRTASGVHVVLGGEWKTFEVSVTAMPDRDSSGGTVLVLEDLTELLKAQKLAAWNEAARRIAHEIKNPLTPIHLAAERILRQYDQETEEFGAVLEDGVQIIVREVKTLKGMVDEFSRFARMPGPQPSEVDLPTLIDDTVQLYRELKPGVTVVTRIAPNTTSVVADPEQLKSAMINLLDNAVEATDPPGTIEVTTRASNGHLQIRIADTGRGIPTPDKEKLFLPHFSTKGRGTGLGLAIVHRIVSDHHGTIRVEDNQPRGTIFTLELPL